MLYLPPLKICEHFLLMLRWEDTLVNLGHPLLICLHGILSLHVTNEIMSKILISTKVTTRVTVQQFRQMQWCSKGALEWNIRWKVRDMQCFNIFSLLHLIPLCIFNHRYPCLDFF